ncbi:MAG: hypothetical protein QOG65_3175 [Actinomycetota bacterium]|nr:hypothetical protein [Actinomycetota bacterium]
MDRFTWLPADFVHPERVGLSTGHHLRPIRASDVDIDYPAVMASRERLWAIFGRAWGWPEPDMTFDEDRDELARHEREIREHLSFNYAVLDASESRLFGCVYIDPAERVGADADVSWWLVADAGEALEAELSELVPRWLASAWPFTNPRFVGRDLSWDDWLALPEPRR